VARDFAASVPKIAFRLQPLPQLEPFLQPVIATDKVRYIGEPVAVVIAENTAAASRWRVKPRSQTNLRKRAGLSRRTTLHRGSPFAPSVSSTSGWVGNISREAAFTLRFVQLTGEGNKNRRDSPGPGE
jgi:hypothetical protein